MRSLHARRPPKLEQGDLRRKRQQKHRNTVHAPTNAGGGSLRRPPNASAIEVPKGGGGSNGGSGGGEQAILQREEDDRDAAGRDFPRIYFHANTRGISLGSSVRKSGVPGLRARQNDESVDANPDAKLG
eukprot:CAMPEP_0172533644 /NCGR_PEP_ID=MMETSP1067-20121228/6267_1 /TAXON_ID=265564 ORGANISM="Thalassiosira punctigera, Strain Tpunct2005C2" /NCGR_SAMPLE_ID=MMETSP1067 /ASSEMBLY_ACC=CAM_ASM_000444 /LENGTH=128 /DNA_ID=CAMNT_0013318307 /DNA_START=508 /DNA_END=893 /DNA_ORIENTATION=+